MCWEIWESKNEVLPAFFEVITILYSGCQVSNEQARIIKKYNQKCDNTELEKKARQNT